MLQPSPRGIRSRLGSGTRVEGNVEFVYVGRLRVEESLRNEPPTVDEEEKENEIKESAEGSPRGARVPSSSTSRNALFFLIFKNVDIVRSTANIVVVNCVVGLSFIVLVCCYGNTDSILGRADEESATRSSLPSFRVAVDVLDPLDFLIWSETEFRLLSTRIPRSLISVRNEEPPFKRNTTKSCCNHEE